MKYLNRFFTFFWINLIYLIINSEDFKIASESVKGNNLDVDENIDTNEGASKLSSFSNNSTSENINLDTPEDKNKMEKSESNKELQKEIDEISSGPCDVVIELADITYEESLLTETKTVNVGQIVCIKMKGRAGTGFIWNFLGVYDKLPKIQHKLFNQLKIEDPFSSQNIIVLPPKLEQKKISTQEYGYGYEGMLGGSSDYVSMAKILNKGVYFLAYAFFRPFNVDETPNVRIVILNAN